MTPSSRGSAGRPAEVQASTGAAFFDFDHTLIEGDAGPLFGLSLLRWRRGRVRERRGFGKWKARLRLWGRFAPFLLVMAVQGARYKLGLAKRSTIVRTAYRGLRGVRQDHFEQLLETFVDEELVHRFFPTMIDEVERHLKAGRRVVIITTGMETLVHRALRHLPPGVDLIGCRLQVVDGRLTGRVVGPLFGVDKANILHAYCRALGIPSTRTWAYSDHASDRAMLEAVSHPVVVHPRRTLRRLAIRRGWRILEPLRPP